MLRKLFSILTIALMMAACVSSAPRAANCSAYPFTLTNGTTADADQVMSNFNNILNCANNNLPGGYTTGTVTPTLTFGGASVGMTYATQKFEYSIIGNRVFFFMQISLSNKGTSVGTAAINVPFPQVPVSTEAFVAVTNNYNFNTGGGELGVAWSAIIGAGFSVRNVHPSGTVGATDANFLNNTTYDLSGSYRF